MSRNGKKVGIKKQKWKKRINGENGGSVIEGRQLGMGKVR